MQNKNPKPQQYIDGFINSRSRRPASSQSIGNRLRSKQSPPIAPKSPGMASEGRPSAPVNQPVPALAPTKPKSPIDLKDIADKGRLKPKANQPKKRWKLITKRAVLIVLALFIVTGGWLGWKVYRNTSKVFGNNNPLQMLSAFKPVPLKGQDTGHVNILLAGNSADRSDGGGGQLTDSIMVASINTETNEAYMLSIPRDLWVEIPGIGGSKINSANTNDSFKENGYPAGGMGALQKVVSETLGIPIHYYSLVNYQAFKDAVDTVGGINVNIQSEDPRGLYDPSFRPHEGGALKLSNGDNHLNGQTALNLARARGDPFNGVYGAYGFPNSDFDRTKHQRLMMLALKEKVMSSKTLANPAKIGSLMDAIGSNVKTDLKVSELVSVYYLMKDIQSSKIKSIGLNDADGNNLLNNYTTDSGQSALVPAAGITDYSAIQAFVNKALYATPVTKEAASVAVLNSGQVSGLAKQTGDYLAKKGLVVSSVGDAPKPYDKTTIIDNSANKKTATKKMLQKAFKNSSFISDAALAQQYPADFIVVLGTSQAALGDDAATNQ